MTAMNALASIRPGAVAPCSDFSDLARRHGDPMKPLEGLLHGVAFRACVAIPDYRARVLRHYGPRAIPAQPSRIFQHFGFVIDFETPVELAVHDGGRRLDEGLRSLIRRYGPLLLRNARMPAEALRSEQRNIFASLEFHLDRGGNQEDRYSLFWRDPTDPVQRQPRSSSTLILANPVAHAQALKEGHGGKQFKAGYGLFKDQDIAPLSGEILFELPWRAPESTGEIAILDNREVLHASYYPRPWDKGYPISVRYLF